MVNSFFTDDDFVTRSTDHLCSECNLDKKCKHPKIQVAGGGALKTLIITDSPDDYEDIKGRMFANSDGEWFKNQLAERKLSLLEDFWVVGSTLCHTPKSPTRSELTHCLPNILKFIKEKKPKFVWLLGETAIESWFMSRFSDTTSARWRALCIPDFERNVWVISTYHHSHVMNNYDNTLITSQFSRDLDFTIDCIKTKPDLKSINKPDIDNIVIMKNVDQVIDELDHLILKSPKYLAFDYETTGLKPYRKEHKIASVSYCSDFDKAYSFPLQHPHWKPDQQLVIEKKWKKVLLNSSNKVAHNIKFEDVWSRMILKTMPNNWHWCSMIAAHNIDNRKKFTGLKFQSFINWGVPNYDKEISAYLESVGKESSNRVMKAPLDKLLLYGGIDALLTYWLFTKQKSMFDKHLEKGLDLFIEGSLALADVQIHGINVDAKYYKQAHIDLEKEIISKEKELSNYPECEQFKKVYGYSPNLGSSKDLSALFFKVLKLTSPKKTDKGNQSVDAEVMSKLNTPLAKAITDLSRIKKVDGTYLSQFIREIDEDGRLHPFYDITNVKTYRGSSNRPNFQNIPMRNEEAKRISRSGIKPSKGYKILDFDYAAIEVRMGACYTKDPVLISYIQDETTDMHRDTAADIFKLKPSKVTKMLRFFVKNGFVFPVWYGSYYKNCATNIWKECANLNTADGISIIEHLLSVGVVKSKGTALESFINHVKKVEKDYWYKFKVFKRWQEGRYRHFEKTGIVELLSGFRCQGYLGRNEIINYAFQGTAFHCLLWSLTQINGEFKDRKMDSKIIGQIHDCAVIDCAPGEEDEVRKLCTEISTERIKEQFTWLNVPLAIEWEGTETDGNWYLKNGIKEED